MNASYTSQPKEKISGIYTPPGDKSISHRAVMFASIAAGKSSFTHFLEADDCLRTMQAFRNMGVGIEHSEGGAISVHGVGLHGLKAPATEIYLGNSGTSMRLLLGILAHQPFEVILTGDESLSKRPMQRVTRPLRKMGAQINGRDDANFAPLVIRGGKLRAIEHVNDPASAQVKSAILLAGLGAEGTTSVRECLASRDHTERMLQMMGASISRKAHLVQIQNTKELRPIQYQIPGDISSAAFFMVAAAILPGSLLTVQNVGLNETRIGILEILKQMGADIEWNLNSKLELEPQGEVVIRGSKLNAVTIGKEMIPSLIDELPILMIACAAAEGISVIQDARELRVKETDRIQSMVSGLKAIGVRAEEKEDGCVIEGLSGKHFNGGTVQSLGDHRTAMSFAIAGMRSKQPVLIEGIECVETSYPAFFEDLAKLS